VTTDKHRVYALVNPIIKTTTDANGALSIFIVTMNAINEELLPVKLGSQLSTYFPVVDSRQNSITDSEEPEYLAALLTKTLFHNKLVRESSKGKPTALSACKPIEFLAISGLI